MPTNALGKLTANSTGITAFNKTVKCREFELQILVVQLNSMTRSLQQALQSYLDAVTIANNPILSGSDITFNTTVDGSSDLTANAVSGNLTFNGAVGTYPALGNITANSTGITAFNKTGSQCREFNNRLRWYN